MMMLGGNQHLIYCFEFNKIELHPIEDISHKANSKNIAKFQNTFANTISIFTFVLCNQ